MGIDGSLIDGTLSMIWADYRKGSEKARVHVGFDLNRSIPTKVHLTDGNGAERPFVAKILSEGQTRRYGISAMPCLISGGTTIGFLYAGSKLAPKGKSSHTIQLRLTALYFLMPRCFQARPKSTKPKCL